MHVSYYNEAYDMLVTWVSKQSFARNARSSLVSVGAKHRRAYTDDDSNKRMKKPLHFSPWNGSFRFWYKNYLLQFQCSEKECGSTQQEITVFSISESSEILREFFDDCRKEYLKLIQKKMSVFEHHDGEWRKAKARDMRPISTVIMDDGEKTELLKDIEDFLDKKTRGWYARRGILYQREFLLYGPPGTGKFSFSLSVAGSFELDIYVVNLSGVNDGSLTNLFAQLPLHCVVLLEDVDAAGTTRAEGSDETPESSSLITTVSPKNSRAETLSLSGLLNALDGVSSQEGRVLIMTTNYIERLDSALIRLGRVDRKVFFQLTDKDMSFCLFCNVFKQSDEDYRNPETRVDNATVEQLAQEFVAKVPALAFSSAKILSFLLERKQSPTDAVNDVEGWVNKEWDEAGLKREYSWVNGM
ncbi:mitochondrial chaperone bcs1, variant [Blastomyces dermatitidis ER-3]|uniref:Mitochondrial chaperone bcs1 n=1 Tax=Ajellomyces dermatitidis (strain ER-3 / ATCC MYA-2586) TaxID=559297 RepID=A0ABP2ERC0_AJEDR|nr:mitochondrial chaperone bcs1 [Blastomyces dermatitidis ER-3]XP_045282868.1 mitochondrial chaperone bcs1, variant [Blastomyces dermatitidis ER-3]EEQ85995.1 mitochondrial chaperone bcs1 [Blastomyces dermatitidis ER-3]OAT03141.1 mitochondrial chaperone bcs1, variant [Blastomyces dermatitidis ER-3]